MTWTLAARIPITQEDRKNATKPEYKGTSDQQFIDIWGGLNAIALSQFGMLQLRLFDWVEFDLSATFVGVISEEEPAQQVVERLKGVHEFMGNVDLDEKQVAFALFVAEEPS